MKNKQFIKLLKETRRKFGLRKGWEWHSKFIITLLRRSDHLAAIKSDVVNAMKIGINAEAALMYVIGVAETIHTKKAKGDQNVSDNE